MQVKRRSPTPWEALLSSKFCFILNQETHVFLFSPDGTITTTFEPTPPMSSFLLAFVISDFNYISNEATKLDNETLHRIWVRPDSTDKAQFALQHSIEALKTLERYLGSNYGMLKIDSAAVPGEHDGLENWGMITYRESAMMYATNFNDIPHDLKLSGVKEISHEISHQFFGDSVTCEWWDYVW